jgi:integrase/recombinase XerD
MKLQPLTISGVSKLFEKLQKQTGIDDKRVLPHQCRRYMATSQLADGRSPLDVQRQMGHTTLMMTNKYASLNIERLKQSQTVPGPYSFDEVWLWQGTRRCAELPNFCIGAQ